MPFGMWGVVWAPVRMFVVFSPPICRKNILPLFVARSSGVSRLRAGGVGPGVFQVAQRRTIMYRRAQREGGSVLLAASPVRRQKKGGSVL